MDFVSSSPPLFLNFHINHSFFKIFIKILKKGGGSREKGGGGNEINEIHAPCACG
jgi:hypothetical protein